MSRGEAYKDLRHELTNEAHRLTVDSFARKVDAYGRPMAPRAKPTGWAVLAFGLLQDSHPLLDKTGKLINSVRAIAVGAGFRITMLWYGVFHVQPDRAGTVLPQRTPLPTARQGLGPVWTRAFLAVSERIAKRYGQL